jgi:histidyl-tRNA synthetase
MITRDALPHLRYEGPHKRSIDIAEYYGFHFLGCIPSKRTDRAVCEETNAPIERAALLRFYLERGMDSWQQPIMVSHTTRTPQQKGIHLKLEMLGSVKSIAEATLIHTVHTILKEHGVGPMRVEVNSVGGKESLDRFTKDLLTFYRKRMNDMHDECRQSIKTDVFAPFRCQNEACRSFMALAPRSISYLSESSRRHFGEVLEYIESFGLPYQIRESLVGNHHYTTRTVFRMHTDTEDGLGEPLVHGERYDNLSKRIGLSRSVPAVGVTITLEPSRAKERIQAYKKHTVERPVAYIVQVGSDARRRSLSVVETLRRAHIPVATSFSEETLHEQMRLAGFYKTPVVIIIGQKEHNEGTVIVRNQETRAQSVVPQAHLPGYLKRLRLA